MLIIADVLDAESRRDIVAALSAVAFEDGSSTAGWSARLVKNNEQASTGATLRLLQERVAKALNGNEVFNLSVRPKTITPILFSRYQVGSSYGSHVDSPLMDGVRTDVSFTLFLSEPNVYAGGELVIETAAGEEEVKLPAGHIVVYPSTTLHRVAAVTEGERLAAVGWVQSYVRDEARRELLFDLETARRRLFEAHGKTAEFDLLSKTAANLFRMWAEV